MRKTTTITIAAEGRDQGKSYSLTEMPAAKAEKWAARALLAMARSGIDIPDGIAGAGLAGIAALGIRAIGGMTFADAEPLMDEMFACAQFVSSSGAIRPIVDGDIEEIATRLRLRREIMALHVDFSKVFARSTSAPAETPTEVPLT